MELKSGFHYSEVGALSVTIQLPSWSDLSHLLTIKLNNSYEDMIKNSIWFRSANFNNYESRGRGFIQDKKKGWLKFSTILYFNYLFHWETLFETISFVFGIKRSLGRRMKFIRIINSLCKKAGVIGCT